MMIIGYILIILGIFGVSGSVVTIKNDLEYNYYTYWLFKDKDKWGKE